MKLLNPKMWFSPKFEQKLEEDGVETELVELKKEDVLKTIEVQSSKNEIKENNQEMSNLNETIDTIVTAVKNAIGIEKAEVEEKVEEQEAQEEKTEETVEATEQQEEKVEEIQEEKVEDAQDVSEETEEVQDEHKEQPSNEAEGNEPPEAETVETEKVEEQEEPQEEVKDEVIIETKDEIPTEVNSIEIPSKEEVEDKTTALLQEIEALKAEKADKELQLQKMEFSKEVAKDYEGVPGKLEDKTEKIFEIKNSALSEDTKAFVLQSLKSLSLQNLKDCEEIGHEQEVEVDEKAERQNKIKEAMDKHGLTENQAFLFVNGDRSLAEAIKASARVQKRK